MVITGISLKQIFFNTASDFTIEGVIPFEGEDRVLADMVDELAGGFVDAF